jgi:hypothetical protein
MIVREVIEVFYQLYFRCGYCIFLAWGLRFIGNFSHLQFTASHIHKGLKLFIMKRSGVPALPTKQEVCMPILDAALAFALTMLVVSTTVTGLVHLLQLWAKTRRTVMKEMLEDYYKKELQPVIKREMIRITGATNNALATEVEKLAKEIDTSKLFSTEEIPNLVEASTSELMERLKRSELGTKLMTDLKTEVDAIFSELGKRYEAIGDKFTASFRDKSKWWATGIALVLALALNIDSIFIMDSYIKNQGLRDAVIAQRDSIEQNYTDLVSKLEGQDDTVTKQELEDAFSESRNQVTSLTGIGLPLGWTYFPYVGLKDNTAKEFADKNNFGGWVFWVLGIALTAGLAGLGGPFWYDAVRGISRAADEARKRKQG